MRQKKKINKFSEKEYLISREVPFSIEEAYKTLRTNLMFSLPENDCKILEITSSMQNEGKSVTAINLAISFKKNGAKVIIVDCDLRLPTIARKLRIDQKPGLTNLLFGMKTLQEVINHHSSGIDVIPAGDLPPNPSEVLGSKNMQTILEHLTKHYDYIIIDAPPVGIVTDAAIISKIVSGVVIVARKDISSTESINASIDALTLVKANILGFVMTDAETDKKHYDKYGYLTTERKAR